MTDEDELHELWKSQPQDGNAKGNDMLEMIQKKMKKFDHVEEASEPLKQFVSGQAGRIELNRNSPEGLLDILLYPR